MRTRSSEGKVDVLLEVVLILLVITAIFLSAAKLLMFAVVEGKSMEPTLQTGDLVFVVKTSPMSIHVGDVVVYRKPSDEFVIHRAIKVFKIGKEVVLITKGDNNLIPDGQIPAEWVVGKVISIGTEVIKIPGVGYLTLCLKAIASDVQHSLSK